MFKKRSQFGSEIGLVDFSLISAADRWVQLGYLNSFLQTSRFRYPFSSISLSAALITTIVVLNFYANFSSVYSTNLYAYKMLLKEHYAELLRFLHISTLNVKKEKNAE